jgi:transcriptional regulator with XRE-family HTH domain
MAPQRPERHPIHSLQALGLAIRRLRKTRGLTQTQLAAAVGGSRWLISRLEIGEPGVSVDQVLDIITELGADLYLEPRS